MTKQDLPDSVQKELAEREQRRLHIQDLHGRLAAAAEEAISDYLPGGALYLPDILDDFYDYDDEPKEG